MLRYFSGEGAEAPLLFIFSLSRYSSPPPSYTKPQSSPNLHGYMYATLPTSQNILSLQIFPFEIRHCLSRHQEVSGPLGELGEVHDVIVRILIVDIDGSLRAHEADVGFTGKDGGHGFVGPKWYYIDSKSNFISKFCHSKQCLGATQA